MGSCIAGADPWMWLPGEEGWVFKTADVAVDVSVGVFVVVGIPDAGVLPPEPEATAAGPLLTRVFRPASRLRCSVAMDTRRELSGDESCIACLPCCPCAPCCPCGCCGPRGPFGAASSIFSMNAWNVGMISASRAASAASCVSGASGSLIPMSMSVPLAAVPLVLTHASSFIDASSAFPGSRFPTSHGTLLMPGATDPLLSFRKMSLTTTRVA